MKLLKSTLFVVLGCACVGNSYAELRVVVTPSKTEEPISETSSQIDIITQEDIEALQPNTITELLTSHAGLEIGRNGSDGHLTSVFTRGSESDHTLFLINGVNFAPDIGQAAIQNIAPEMIERIEVVKGPRSTLYGTGAIGGVINIITKKGADGFHGSTTIRAGRYDTLGGNTSISYADDVINSGLSVSYHSQEGPTAVASSPDEDEFERTNANAFIDFKLDQYVVGINHTQAYTELDYDNTSPSAFIPQQEQTNSITQLKLGYEDDQLAVNVNLAHAVDEIEQTGTSQPDDFANTQRDILDIQASYDVLENFAVLFGVESVIEEAEALSFGTAFNEDFDRNAVFAQLDFGFDANQFTVGARTVDYESFGTHTTGTAEYARKLGENGKFFVSVGSAFRAPSVVDLFGFGGNPDLEPEEAVTTEVGAQYIQGDNYFKASIFKLDVENLVNFDQSFTRINIDEASNRGLELSYNHKSESLSTFVNFLIQNPINEANDTSLARRSSLNMNAGFNYAVNQWAYGAVITHVGSRFSGSNEQQPLNPYTLLDLSLSYDVVDNVQLSLTGKNVGNVEYQTAIPYVNPKAAYYAALKVDF